MRRAARARLWRPLVVVGAVALVIGGTATPALANQAPVTESDFYSMAAGTILEVEAPGVLANDVDPDGDPLTIYLDIQYDSNVELREDGSFTFTPPPGFTGNFYSFDYYAFDADITAYGHVYITIYPDAAAANDSYLALNTRPLNVRQPGVLANDTGVAVGLVSGPAHGTLQLRPTGGFTYTAQAGYTGSDSFRYRTWSGFGRNVSAPATVTIRVKASNAAPVALADSFVTDEDTALLEPAPGVLANDADPDGDPLILELISYPYGDSFELFPDGSFEYYPPPDYDSPVTFQYRLFDGLAYSAVATATIDIRFVNDPPTAYEDEFSFVGRRLDVATPGVLGNDEGDVEGDAPLAVLDTQPQFGFVWLKPDGSFTYVRVGAPQPVDYFTYHVEDSGGAIGNSVAVSVYR